MGADCWNLKNLRAASKDRCIVRIEFFFFFRSNGSERRRKKMEKLKNKIGEDKFTRLKGSFEKYARKVNFYYRRIK